ncbi:MAG: phosphate ABC transporter permease PstA [Thermoplasmata archaeon]
MTDSPTAAHRRLALRQWKSRAMGVLAVGCVAIALLPLGSILWTCIQLGGPVLSSNFVFGKEDTFGCPLGTPHCGVGGIGPALEGTLLLMGLAALMAIPVGVLAAIYLNEYARGKVGRTISFLMDVMSGVPSIVVGVFIFVLFQLYFRQQTFSAISGAVALAVIMVPIVTRTAEEALRLVPDHLREAALALGVPQHQTVRKVVLRTSLPTLVTGALLAVARAGGETAPLLFTAFGNPFFPEWNKGIYYVLTHPVGAIPLLIYNGGLSPWTNQIADAWGASLVIILLMLAISLLARLALIRRTKNMMGAG